MGAGIGRGLVGLAKRVDAGAGMGCDMIPGEGWLMGGLWGMW